MIEPTAPSIVDFYLWLEETFGEEYVEQLAALEPRIYPSSLPIGEALASGEISATPYAAPQTLEPLKAQGAPVEYGISAEGAWGARFFGMVPTTAPNPQAGLPVRQLHGHAGGPRGRPGHRPDRCCRTSPAR